jgi:hypothetical protein
MKLAYRGAIAIAVMIGFSASLAHAQPNPDGLIQVAEELEGRAYTESTEALLTYFWPLMFEVDQLPDPPSPAHVKASPIRTLLLNYRLMMDFHAFVYEPGLMEAYRGALDSAYDRVGKYREILDIEEFTGTSVDPRESAVRLARMNFALAPLRFNSFREDTKEFAYSRAFTTRVLREDEIPEIWIMSGERPRESLDDAGNAALLARGMLGRVQADGILVNSVLDPAQEDFFRHVRRSMRDALVLCDMYPSLSRAVASVRPPLANLVEAYGDVNDKLDAYKAAVEVGSPVGDRQRQVQDAFKDAMDVAEDVVRKRSIQDYMDALTSAMESHRR